MQTNDETPRAPVEFRAAVSLDNVNFPNRIITVIAVPYDDPTQVEYRGQVWNEVFSRSAFRGIESRQRPVPVLADLSMPKPQSHEGSHLVGRVAQAVPDHETGLLLHMHISKTQNGDAALELANDGALFPSVGVAMRSSDQLLDRQTMTRRINKAFLDHLALVPQPAYLGAKVLAVRSADVQIGTMNVNGLVEDPTPNLDEVMSNNPLAEWVRGRLEGERENDGL